MCYLLADRFASAIDAVMSFGRPKSVELLDILINRRFTRDLPIQPNYVGKNIDVMDSEKIIVEWQEISKTDRVLIKENFMINNLSSTHLLGIKHLTASDINLIFKTADNFKKIINQPIKKVPSLRDITIANLFFENSTRTKLSF